MTSFPHSEKPKRQLHSSDVLLSFKTVSFCGRHSSVRSLGCRLDDTRFDSRQTPSVLSSVPGPEDVCNPATNQQEKKALFCKVMGPQHEATIHLYAVPNAKRELYLHSRLCIRNPFTATQPLLEAGLSPKTPPFFSNLVFLGTTMHPYERRTPIFFLVFLLLLYCGISH